MRRRERTPYAGPVRLSWDDGHGNTKYMQGKCVDVSESGLRIAVPEPIPLRTHVVLSSEPIQLAGSGTVKHVARMGAKYIIGLELSQPLGGVSGKV